MMWFTCSWDDGHPLDRKLADLMAKHGIRGSFYCPIHNREGLPVMAAADLRALDHSDGAFEIGSHTRDHAYASRLAPPDWARQVVQGKSQLEDLLGHAVAGFCYPGGQHPAGAALVVAAAGFAYARTTQNLRSDCGQDAFAVPTTLQCYPHTRSVLLRNYLRHGAWRCRAPLAAACLAMADLEGRLQRALAHCQSRGGVFHLWGHSWEIEALGLWPLLDRFFASIAACVPADARLTHIGLLRQQGLLA
jgi:peptidoglycan/xylan/chitin deacetylase (PgdA/CDA1 family)